MVVCRQEWRSQQAVRAGHLQHVTKTNSGKSSFWVEAPAPHPHCYFITWPHPGDSNLVLLDPSQEAAQPVRLAISPFPEFRAFILSDGALRIVERVVDRFGIKVEQMTGRLRWHTFDPATGRILASELKHTWPEPGDGPDFASIYHARTHKVIAFDGSHTLVIMDAESLADITRCDLSLCHLGVESMSLTMLQIAWSPSGLLLAVVLADSPQHDSDVARLAARSKLVAEVHIHDTATGHCLQSISLSASSNLKLRWSPSGHVLAVQSQTISPANLTHMETNDAAAVIDSDDLHGLLYPHDPDQSSDDEHPDWQELELVEHWRFEGRIHLLSPFNKSMHLPECRQEAHPTAQWTDCEWSPHGHFLVAHWISKDSFGYCVIDPSSMHHIHSLARHAQLIWWACQPPLLHQGSRISAYFFPCQIVVFSLADTGTWKVDAFSSQQDEQHHHDWYPIAGIKNAHGCRQTQQAPWPSCWPGLYATVTFTRPSVYSSCVKLVDSTTKVVVGTWTADMLNSISGRRLRGKGFMGLHGVDWAPNCRHLAVFSDRSTLVLAFG